MNTKDKIDLLCSDSNRLHFSDINSIIDKYFITYSKNSNGIFLNLSLLNNTIIDELFIVYINNKSKIIQDVDNEYITDHLPTQPVKKIKKKHIDIYESSIINKTDCKILKILLNNINLI